MTPRGDGEGAPSRPRFVLVELYDEANLERVLEAGAALIGVNNRNLHTFEVDLQHVVRMRRRVPAEHVLVAESGIAGPADLRMLEQEGIDAALVGEHLMRQSDVGAAVRRLLARNP